MDRTKGPPRDPRGSKRWHEGPLRHPEAQRELRVSGEQRKKKNDGAITYTWWTIGYCPHCPKVRDWLSNSNLKEKLRNYASFSMMHLVKTNTPGNNVCNGDIVYNSGKLLLPFPPPPRGSTIGHLPLRGRCPKKVFYVRASH